MMTFLTLTCFALSLGWAGLLNRLASSISRKLGLRVNRLITGKYAPGLFSIMAAYLDFRFAGDAKSKAQLPDQYMVLSNHQSLMDIPLLMRFLDGPRLRFVAKAELARYVPVVSLVLRSDGHCLIKRTGNAALVMREMDSFAERVNKNGWIPVIFPEGTRSRDGSVGPFLAAGFRRLAEKAPMPVAVCAIDGGWQISSLIGMAKHLKGGFYRVKVLKIYPAPTSKAEQVHILEEGRALIEEQLEMWRSGRQE
jgi:1-acyl-sn-glycerol-3-phosphate acyltransferase